MPRLAVLGHPVAHSRSPAMHNAALAALGMAGEWSYEAIDVSPEGFAERVGSMPGEGFAGANVTVPHKEAALAIADIPNREALAIGAANTLVFTAEGIAAHNTDARGLLAALRALPASPRGRRALVLGAGGAARAAIWALARGDSTAAIGLEALEVDVWNRTAQRAEAAAAQLGGRLIADPEQSDYGLIVNATTVGLRGEDPFAALPLRPEFFAGQVVVDMVYGGQSGRLVEAARAGGASTVDGIDILVHQGARSLRIWTGHEPPLDVMERAAREGLSR